MKNFKYIKMIRLNTNLTNMLFLCFMLCTFIFNAEVYSETKPDVSEQYVSEGRYFKVNLPSGWGKKEEIFGLSSEEKKVYGVNVLGPISKYGIAPMISVHYYAQGNLLHKTIGGFINLHAQSALGANLDGEEYSPVRIESVAGRPAKVFDRKVCKYIPPEVLNPKKIAIYERFVVMPASEGFYVLRYSAPEDTAEKYQGVFEKVISSFEPLIQ